MWREAPREIDPEIARLFRARLQEGETILWQGQPDPLTSARSGAVSGWVAIFLFLFGMLWLEAAAMSAIRRPASLLNPSLLSPLLLIAVVLGWGAWSAFRSALRTGFAVTDRRLLLVLSAKEPIFSGRGREPWGYVKLSVAASGVGTVTVAPSANASATTYVEAREAAGLFTLVAGDMGGPELTSQNLLPPFFGPAQMFLAPGERVLWEAKADEGLLARSLTKSAWITQALGAILSSFAFTAFCLSFGSTPPPVYLLLLTAPLVLGIASWFLTPRWATRKAARTAADWFYALTNRRLVIARRTNKTEIVQFALDRLKGRESVPRRHKIRLNTLREADSEMLHLADPDQAYALLTEAVSRAKASRPAAPEDGPEPDLSGIDPLRKQLKRGEEILWRGGGKGGGWREAIQTLGGYVLTMLLRVTLVILAFPLVMGSGGYGWGQAGLCVAVAAFVVLCIAASAWGNIRSQEYAITGERLLIVKKTKDGKRRLLQADLRGSVNIALSVSPKTGRAGFEIACRDAAATFAEADGRFRRLSLSLLGVGDPVRVYNLLTTASLARLLPQSVLDAGTDGVDPFAPFLRPDEVIRWQGSPEAALAGGGARWDSDRFLSPVWALIWVGLLAGAAHLSGYGWPTAALRALPPGAPALAALYDPNRPRRASEDYYALTDQRLLFLSRTKDFVLSDLDLERVERIITQQKPGGVATFVFTVGENRVRWADVADADAVYRLVDGAVVKAKDRSRSRAETTPGGGA